MKRIIIIIPVIIMITIRIIVIMITRIIGVGNHRRWWWIKIVMLDGDNSRWLLSEKVMIRDGGDLRFKSCWNLRFLHESVECAQADDENDGDEQLRRNDPNQCPHRAFRYVVQLVRVSWKISISQKQHGIHVCPYDEDHQHPSIKFQHLQKK